MMKCRACGGDIRVVATEDTDQLVTDGRDTQAIRWTRQCERCGDQKETTERWVDDDEAEFYRARYEQAAGGSAAWHF